MFFFVVVFLFLNVPFQVQDLVLEELCLHGCKELTNYSMEVLVKHQPSLQRLDISACPELTNRSVEAVAQGLKTLTHLSLSRDWRITEKGLLTVKYSQFLFHTLHACAYLSVLPATCCVTLKRDNFHLHRPR